MAADKVVAGILAWVDSPPRLGALQLKAQLDIGGQGRTGLELQAYTNRYWSPQAGSLVVVYRNLPIARMSLWPRSPHSNGFDKAVDRKLRGVTLPAGLHRYYPWQHNRRAPKLDRNIHYAELIPERLDSFAVGIQYFCNRARISGVIPSPPFEPRLPL